MTELHVGDEAPDFALPSIDNETLKLTDFRGSKVVLAFHPLAWTGVCGQEMQELNDLMPELAEKNATVLSISVDSIPSKMAWFAAMELENLYGLADFEPKGEVARLYGVYREDGFSERALFLVDESGKIAFKQIYKLARKPDLKEILERL